MTRSSADALVEALRPSMPIQNPLWAFVHNNILLNLEHLPFHEALKQAAAWYRARPYETEAFYREELARGRLHRASLEAVLRERLPGVTVDAFLGDPTAGDDEPAVRVLRPGALDPEFDRQLQDVVVPVVSAWLDQGMAAWDNPWRDRSVWLAFVESVTRAPAWLVAGGDAVRARVVRHLGRAVDDVIAAELEAVPEAQRVDWCREVLFSLKGWSGMVARLEAEPALAPVASPPASLKDWLAVLLVVSHALDATTATCAPDDTAPGTRHLGRLRRLHDAYERSFAVDLLAHLEGHLKPAAPTAERRREVQALLCMDDREESFRRALEAQDVETVGSVGFYGVDMRFHGVGQRRATRQCPPVVEPSRTIREVPADGEGRKLDRLVRAGQTGAAAELGVFYHSRSLLRGVALSLSLGLFSFLPLVFKLLWPSAVTRWRERLQRWAFPRPRTRMVLDEEGGYSVDEQSRLVESILRAAGFDRGFAPVFAVIGHGSTSTNNPFRQAYGCGACSGNPGAPNARAFAQMANDARVRARLAYRGLVIPDETRFVPCFHDTSLDVCEVLDREQLDDAFAPRLAGLEATFAEACRLDVLERCARFAQAPATSDDDALAQHVLDRGHDLAQPRPEYGHNRVAACIVGRRELTADVFLDRRCFLVSYDPTRDDDGRQLPGAVLGSVPVAVNIGMDYYFSRVDPDGFGAGSKLPLNVTSLLGVITGSKSDLRLGLARQMVELHEPMRMLVLLEASEAAVRDLISGNARLTRLVDNGWMRLGRIDPVTRAILLRGDDDVFRPWRDALPEASATPPPGKLPRILDVAFDRLGVAA